MTEPRPDADELRVRHALRTRGVGPDATPLPPMPTTPPTSYARPRDWLDDIINTPAPAPAPAAPRTDATPKPAPSTPPRARAARHALAEAAPSLPPRLRWLALHATAAAAGWPIGLVTWGTDTARWYAAGHWTDSSAWALYAIGLGALALYRRTRHRMLLIAWLGAIPVSSVALGVLLYGRAA